MAPNVTAHFFAANDINGSPIHEITDEDSFFRDLTLSLERDGLGSADLLLSRMINFAGFASGTFQPEVFVRFLVSAYSDTVYYPWAFSMEKRQQVVIHKDEKGAETFRFGGPGPKALLSRHALGIRSHLAGEWNIDLTSGVWRWTDNASIGQILNRILNEDQARPNPSLPFMTTTFNASTDSNSVAWTDTDIASDGLYEIPIGTDYLTILRDLDDLVELTSWIDLGTVASPKYELNVIQGLGDDRMGSAFGAGVCLFKEGENIANDSLTVEGQNLRKASHVIVEGKDAHWVVAERLGFSPGDYVKYAKIEYGRSSSDYWLEKAGIRWLKSQDRGEREYTVQIVPGASDSTGLYFPAPDRVLWLSNLVSLDSSADGSSHSELDVDPADEQLVTGIDLSLGVAGDDSTADKKAKSWDIKVHLNKERPGVASKAPSQASASSGDSGCKCLRLCPATVEPADATEDQFLNANDPGGTDPGWVGLLGNQGGSGDGADGTDWYNFKSTSPNQYQTTHACNAGDEVTVTGWYEQNNTGIMIIAFTTAPPGSTGTVVPGTAIGTPAELHTAGTGGGHAWIPFSHSETAPSGTTSYALGRKTSSISFDEVRVTIGTPVEGTNPLHGTDGTAAHCDHIHHAFSDVDPTVDDDESEGYRAGTFWVNTDTGDVFILLDATDGAADWLPVGGGSSGSVATDTIWDAKGDLAAGTGADTAAKLTVGANDTILMADSAQSTGLKWVASGTPSTQAFGDAAAVGTADTFTRGDHKHAMPADPVTAHAAASDPHTGYVLESLVDAKGDLLTATADNTPARLAVGSNGKILVADSAETTGLKWATGGTIAVTVAGNLGDIPPSSPGTYDEEFLGTADTLPTDWAWTSAPSGSDTWKLNSRWPSLLTVEGTGNTSYTLTRSNFTAGATFGIWGKFLVGPFSGADVAQLRMYAFNSGSTEGRAVTYRATGSRAAGVRALRTISSVESVWGTEKTGMEPGGGSIYLGFVRTSNNFEAWYSRDGIAWDQLAGSQSHTFTIDRLKFTISTSSLTSLIGMDWIRYRTDTAFPRP